MKHLKWLLLSGMLLMLSCNSDDSTTDEETDNKLIGTWELLRHENIDGGSANESPAGESPITITFSPDNNYTGSTQNNEFDGEFENDEQSIILTKFVTTAVSETEWGTTFYNALGESTQENNLNIVLQYAISSDSLFLKYNETRRMLLIQK
ncbi:META domain-containing protein [Pseudozobellia sp. WGM2]|uniref:META domain-containing protein n=1 Tax=Pseudozobellia sp. WGM2 TaxID=2787625 RepID=UPI001AE0CD3D|nr:META domain-containing protein [Pseudozobellia sp. WGM2]